MASWDKPPGSAPRPPGRGDGGGPENSQGSGKGNGTPGTSRLLLWIAIALVFAVVLIVSIGADTVATTLGDGDNIAQMIGVGMALLLAAAAFSRFGRHLSWGTALRYLAGWGAIIAVLALAFPLVRPLLPDRFQEGYDASVAARARFDPVPKAQEEADGAVRIPADRAGHYSVFAEVASGAGHADAFARVRFLVDSGASTVVLTTADARRIGLNLQALTYSQRFETANGVTRAAPIVLDELRIGGIVLHNVAASVNEAPMSTSLLGMSFLSRLARFEVAGNEMLLVPAR